MDIKKNAYHYSGKLTLEDFEHVLNEIAKESEKPRKFWSGFMRSDLWLELHRISGNNYLPPETVKRFEAEVESGNVHCYAIDLS